MFAPDHGRFSHKQDGGPCEQVIDRNTNPAHEAMLCPAREVMTRLRRSSACLPQNSLQISNCFRFSKPALIKLYLITLLKSCQQVHAINGAEIQIILKG